jgi:hypothetical protein
LYNKNDHRENMIIQNEGAWERKKSFLKARKDDTGTEHNGKTDCGLEEKPPWI